MRGYAFPKDGDLDSAREDDALPAWESLVVNAVGTVIEFWGFKHNQGRVWALLFLRDEALTAAEIRDTLLLSKGAVSMILRELETWGVLHRVRRPGSQAWHFVAEVELLKMIGHVFKAREVHVVQRVKEDLEDAERMALARDDVPPQVLERLQRMRKLAGMIEHALDVFLKTARLDIAEARGIFKTEDPDALPDAFEEIIDA